MDQSGNCNRDGDSDSDDEKQKSKRGASPRKIPSKPKQKLNEKGKELLLRSVPSTTQSIHENIEATEREKDSCNENDSIMEANTHKNVSKPTLIPLLSAVECEEGEIQQIKPLDESKLNETDVWFRFIGSYSAYTRDIQRVIMICEGFTNDVQFQTHKLHLESAGSDLRASLRLKIKHNSASIQCKIYEILQNAKNKITAHNPHSLSALYHLTKTSSSVSLSAASMENVDHEDDSEHKCKDGSVPLESERSVQLEALRYMQIQTEIILKELTPKPTVSVRPPDAKPITNQNDTSEGVLLLPSSPPPQNRNDEHKPLSREKRKKHRTNHVLNSASDTAQSSCPSVASIAIKKASTIPQKRKFEDNNTNAPPKKKPKIAIQDPSEQASHSNAINDAMHSNVNSIPQDIEYDKKENDSSEEYDRELQQSIENLKSLGFGQGLIEFVMEIDPNAKDFNSLLSLCLNNREYYEKSERMQRMEDNNTNCRNNIDKSKWSANDCAEWVGSLGSTYQQYMQLFNIKNDINGALLTQLDDTALAPIIASKLHRTKILVSWRELQKK